MYSKPLLLTLRQLREKRPQAIRASLAQRKQCGPPPNPIKKFGSSQGKSRFGQLLLLWQKPGRPGNELYAHERNQRETDNGKDACLIDEVLKDGL